jgi:hypothetical protein
MSSTRTRVSLVLSAVLVLVGLTMIVRTALEVGLEFRAGYLLGPALVLAGLGRGWLALQSGKWK